MFCCNGDSSSNEGWFEDEEEQLNDEGGVFLWVIVEDDLVDVVEEFEEGIDGEIVGEVLGFGFLCELFLGDKEGQEGNGEEDIGFEIEVVFVQCQFNGILRGYFIVS